MEVTDLITAKMDRLSDFKSRITVLENQLRDRQYRDLLARVERLEQCGERMQTCGDPQVRPDDAGQEVLGELPARFPGPARGD